MKRKKQLLTIAAMLLAVISAAAYTVFVKSKAEEEKIIYTEEIVKNGELMQGITERGSIVLETKNQRYEVIIDEEDSEEEDDGTDSEEDAEETAKHLKIEEVYVKQGQRIRAGDKVMKLTEKSIRAVRRYLETKCADAEIRLEELQNEYEVEQVVAENTYQKSIVDSAWSEIQYAIDTAEIETEIAALVQSVSVLAQEIKQLEAELTDSWDDYADLKEEYEKYERRYQEWDKDNLYLYIPLRETYLSTKEKYETETQSRQDKREEIAEKQEEMTNIQADVQRLLNQAERRQLDARQTYDSAVLDGSMAKTVYDYALQSLEKNMESAREELETWKERLTAFDAFVGEEGVVYAEGEGLVTRMYYEAEDILRQDSTLLTYVQEDAYILSIDIAQEDIPYVEVGDEVTIVFTAYPEESYQGCIEEIVSTETSQNTATVSYPVTVRVLGDTSLLYGGMTGDVTFITQQTQKVNYVSRKAVQKKDGKTYVWIKDEAGELVQKEVETGFTDGRNVQIVSGLMEGDRVYVESRVTVNEKLDETK